MLSRSVDFDFLIGGDALARSLSLMIASTLSRSSVRALTFSGSMKSITALIVFSCFSTYSRLNCSDFFSAAPTEDFSSELVFLSNSRLINLNLLDSGLPSSGLN